MSTFLCTPAWTSEEATIAVEPPTEPAVCTRRSGLPAAPIDSARNSSGIITPSNRSGALPTTIASISSSVILASSSARSIASRSSPAMETSSRLARWWVWPTPITAAGCLPITRPALRWPSRTRGSAAAPARRWHGRAPSTPRPTRSASRPRRCGCRRRRTSGCWSAHRRTG